jgi:hypothetical protein
VVVTLNKNSAIGQQSCSAIAVAAQFLSSLRIVSPYGFSFDSLFRKRTSKVLSMSDIHTKRKSRSITNL